MFMQGVVYALLAVTSLVVWTSLYGEPFGPSYRVLAALAAIFAFFTFRGISLFSMWRWSELPRLIIRFTFAWTLVVLLMLALVYLLQLAGSVVWPVILGWMLVTPLVLLVAHLGLRAFINARFEQLLEQRRALIVFASDASRQLAESVRSDPHGRFQVIGYLDDREEERTGPIRGLPNLGKAANVAEVVEREDVQVVFVVLPEIGLQRARSVIEELDKTRAAVYYVPDLYVLDLGKARVGEINGIPVLELSEMPIWGVDGVLKRLFDFMVGLVILLLISPVMLAIALAIKLDDRGPIFYHQQRCGLRGKRFWVRKFRSMKTRPEPEGAFVQQATRGDPRVTRVGRVLRATSLDELPQFWNVVVGDMSIVGPRPHALSHDDHYRREIRRYISRHKVLPGVTGWAQINGLRGEIESPEDMARRIEFDLDYIRYWSPALDLKIILLTIPRMLRDPAAY